MAIKEKQLDGDGKIYKLVRNRKLVNEDYNLSFTVPQIRINKIKYSYLYPLGSLLMLKELLFSLENVAEGLLRHGPRL